MKKLIVALMTVLFLGSTTAVVLADNAAPATTPVAKTEKVKKSKKVKKAKKAKKAKKEKKEMTAPAASSTPASK